VFISYMSREQSSECLGEVEASFRLYDAFFLERAFGEICGS